MQCFPYSLWYTFPFINIHTQKEILDITLKTCNFTSSCKATSLPSQTLSGLLECHFLTVCTFSREESSLLVFMSNKMGVSPRIFFFSLARFYREIFVLRDSLLFSYFSVSIRVGGWEHFPRSFSQRVKVSIISSRRRMFDNYWKRMLKKDFFFQQCQWRLLNIGK